MSTMKEWALSYAITFGWDVGPLHEWRDGRCTCGKAATCGTPAKHPRWMAGIFEHGLRSATHDPDIIRALWDRYPTANIFRRPGPNEAMLDVDPRAGGDERLAELEAEHGPLPETITCLTGGGGTHYTFTISGPIRGRVIAPGLELKGPDQLLVLPPSRHKSGARYQWEASGHPADVSAAPLPTWLMPADVTLGHAPMPPVTGDIPTGERNTTLASMAGTMRRRGFSVAAIEAALLVENADRCIPPLDPDEVTLIARSISRYVPARQPQRYGRSREGVMGVA